MITISKELLTVLSVITVSAACMLLIYIVHVVTCSVKDYITRKRNKLLKEYPVKRRSNCSKCVFCLVEDECSCCIKCRKRGETTRKSSCNFYLTKSEKELIDKYKEIEHDNIQ